jgi:hypothetical protein
MKRYNDALFIADGACNPSGIAISIVDACREIRSKPNAGTVALTGDPAIRLMVHQLAFICGIVSGAEEFYNTPDYHECTVQCKAMVVTAARPTR